MMNSFVEIANRMEVDTPAWLLPHVKANADLFAQAKLPNTKNERWKYSDLSALTKEKFTLASAETIENNNIDDIINSHQVADDSIVLVCLNGNFHKKYSRLHHLPKEVTLTSIATASKTSQGLIVNSLFNNNPQSFFVNLNKIEITKGLFLNIPKNLTLTRPIHFLNIVTDKTTNIIVNPFLFINLEDHSQATLLEEYNSFQAENYFTNALIHINLNSHAQLKHYKVQDENKNSCHVSHLFVQQAENSKHHFINLSLGAKFARDEITVALLKPYAEFSAKAFYNLTHDNQQIDHYLDANHLAALTNSEMLYKGLLDKKSRAVFNGRVFIEKQTAKINAYQANHNLLLTNSAEVYSKPELEIYADDVKCKHGSSTGMLDQDAIFYLRARGLSENQAIKLLLNGFADEVLQFIHLPSLRKKIRSFFDDCF